MTILGALAWIAVAGGAIVFCAFSIITTIEWIAAQRRTARIEREIRQRRQELGIDTDHD